MYPQAAGSRRCIIDTRRRPQWCLVSLKVFFCKGIQRKVSKMPGVYLSTSKFYAKEGTKEPFFFPAQAWRPSTYEGAHLLQHSLLLRSTTSLQVRSCGVQIAAHFCSCSTMEGLVSRRGGGAAPYRPLCSVVCSRGGKALYRPLFADLYSKGGRVFTVSCVRLYMAGEGQLSTVPCVRFCVAQWGVAL